METGIIRLKWEVDSSGYQLVEREERGGTILTHSPAGTYIVPRGGKRSLLDVGLQDHDIFLDLANAPTTHDGVLAFTNRWGQLAKGDEQAVSEFFAIQQSMAWSMTAPVSKVRQALRKKDALGSLKIDLEGKHLALLANALVQFCWLQRLHALDAGADIARCPECKLFLPNRYKPGRVKKHCSNACKQRLYRRNRT